jgi:hypothetical protein
LSVFVLSLRPEPPSDSTTICTLGRGSFFSFTTLPRIIVDCASAGTAMSNATIAAATLAVKFCVIGIVPLELFCSIRL